MVPAKWSVGVAPVNSGKVTVTFPAGDRQGRSVALAAPLVRPFQQAPRDDLRLDLRRALEDVEDARVGQQRLTGYSSAKPLPPWTLATTSLESTRTRFARGGDVGGTGDGSIAQAPLVDRGAPQPRGRLWCRLSVRLPAGACTDRSRQHDPRIGDPLAWIEWLAAEPWVAFAVVGLYLLLALAFVVDAMLIARRSDEFALRWYNLWWIYVAVIVIAQTGASFVDLKRSVQTFYTPSASMVPTLLVGDYFIVDKRAYDSRDPARGDLAVFKLPRDTEKLFIKRVVGLPGDEVQVKGGVLYINGSAVSTSEAGTFSYDAGLGDRRANVPMKREALADGAHVPRPRHGRERLLRQHRGVQGAAGPLFRPRRQPGQLDRQPRSIASDGRRLMCRVRTWSAWSAGYSGRPTGLGSANGWTETSPSRASRERTPGAVVSDPEGLTPSLIRPLEQAPRDDLRLDLVRALEDLEDARVAEHAADAGTPRRSRCRRGSARASAASQATRAASSFAMPASRSQRRPLSFWRAAK